MRTRDVMRAARKAGREAGQAAASWAHDGNTQRSWYERTLKGIQDGDPAVLDQFNLPNLSGEYADDPTPQRLAEDIGIEPDDERLDDACAEWENESATAFWEALERECRQALKP